MDALLLFGLLLLLLLGLRLILLLLLLVGLLLRGGVRSVRGMGGVGLLNGGCQELSLSLLEEQLLLSREERGKLEGESRRKRRRDRNEEANETRAGRMKRRVEGQVEVRQNKRGRIK